MPSTSTASCVRSPPVDVASFWRSLADSFSRSLTSARSASTLPEAVSGVALRAPHTDCIVCDIVATCVSAASPVTASMRLTPLATPASAVIQKRPMSPVRETWVPPQSSTEKRSAPIVSTLTSSPYFSPNSAIAPAAMASSMLISSVDTSALARTWSFTMAVILARVSADTGSPCEKSNRKRWESTSEPFCRM